MQKEVSDPSGIIYDVLLLSKKTGKPTSQRLGRSVINAHSTEQTGS